MNRIRKVNNKHQVLITPDIKISPDSSLLLGNWTDENLRNYYVEEHPTLNSAMGSAFDYPEIDWYKMILNHKYIFQRLSDALSSLIQDFNIEFIPKLMTPDQLKNIMFDRVIRGGERFNLAQNVNDIISFTIVNPWSITLQKISKIIENYHNLVLRDDLRIRQKKVINSKIIILYGVTEYGTTYEIKLVPTLLHQWTEWYNKNGFRNEQAASIQYSKLLKTQNNLDNGTKVL